MTKKPAGMSFGDGGVGAFFVLLGINGNNVAIAVGKIVSVCELPEGGCDVYTNEPAEANAHFRVDDDFVVIMRRMRDAQFEASTP